MALSWQVPTTTVNNTFSVTLVSDAAITGVEFNDFRLRGADGTSIIPDSTNCTLTQVSGTNNYRLDWTLTGTRNQLYSIRLRQRRVQEAGVNVPSSHLDSSTFLVDSSFSGSTPVIQSTARQNIIVDTDYSLTINISGNPLEAYATGDLEGFEQDWDADAGTLKIFGRPDRNFSGGWLVHAKDRVDPTNIVTDDVFFDVVPKAPIFGTLPDIHLYREVPLNIDIPIQNLGGYTAKSLLVGMKSEKVEEGVKIGGQLSGDTEYTIAESDIAIVAEYAGGVSQMRDFPIFIEEGAVPELGAITVTPKGNYAEVTFDELNHAIAYEWLREDIDVLWQSFSENRNIINPATVAVENGNLQAAVSFQRVLNANAYQYRVNIANSQGQWVDFVGTLANDRITTIIPDLEEGVTYTVQLRVSSPWIGVPITLSITGGRLAYCVNYNGANSALYIFNTGTAENAIAATVKKILLPTGNADPRGIAIRNGNAYCLDGTDRRIYVFPLSTAHNARAVAERSFTVPGGGRGRIDDLIDIFGDTLYFRNAASQVVTLNPDTANNAAAAALTTRPVSGGSSDYKGIAVTEPFLFISGASELYIYPREGTVSRATKDIQAFGFYNISVVDDILYVIGSGTTRIDVYNHSQLPNNVSFSANAARLNRFILPAGCDTPRALKVAT